jgi:hypothetical protein
LLALLAALAACRSEASRSAPALQPRPAESAAPARPALPPAPVLSSAAPVLQLKSCAPCRFVASPDLQFDVRFQPQGEQGVTELQIARASSGSAPQVFPLTDAWSPTGDFLLQAMDLNFDGVLDLAFGAVLGTPNLTLDYWAVDPQRAALDPIGKLTNLTVDLAAHELRTHEKGGHGGLLEESKAYRWESRKLLPVRVTSQTESPDGRGYVKDTQQLEGGRVVKETREAVKPR